VFDRFQARETVLAADLAPSIVRTLKLTVYVSYQGKVQPAYSYVLPQNGEGEAQPITDFKEACRLINEEISPLLKGRDVLGLKKIDDTLLAFQKKKAEQEVQVSDQVLRACSEAILYAYGQSTSPAAPYKALYKYLKNRDLEWGPGAALPKMIFNVLNGGKAVASKVKFSKFFLILDMTPEDELDPMEVYLKIQA